MSFTGSISVVNRKGETVPMHLETISKRLADLVEMEPPLTISSDYVASKTAAALINGIKTSEIDSISAGICASLIVDDYEYDELAARIIISSLHKTTYSDLRKYAKALKSYQYRNTEIKILHPKTIAFILENSKDLHDIIDYSKDYTYNYFGAVTLINSYLLSYKYDNDQKIVVERPQQMLMRVAIGIHLNEICDDGSCTNGTFQSISETYKLLSDKYYTHATPTLFNAGTINHTLSSCYLLSVNDSLENIYQRLTDISKISKFSGGVGIHVSQVRAQGSVIASTVGRSEGLVPMLRMYNESTKYVSQGGGKRKGSTAVYLEPWHADIESCILSQKQQGVPEKLCRDLFLALWVPDLFMERLKKSIKTGEPTMWSLMCPDECKGLADVYGDEFKHLYESYEKKGMYRKQMPIVQLWNLIVSTQIETGKPYLMYKDHVNRKCNQNNLGTIKSSNLCVAGDTKILTKAGYQEIRSLAGQNVEVWNGHEWSLAPVAQTGTNQKLIKVSTDDGCSLECTPYHKFHIVSGARNNKHIIKTTETLDIKDRIVKCEFPIIEGTESFKYPYTHGFYCADGTDYLKSDGSRKMPVIDLYHDKQSLQQYIEYDHSTSVNIELKRQRFVLHRDISDKFEVPLNSSVDIKLQWLAGYVDGDGTMCKNGLARCLQIASIHTDFLFKVKLLCNTLGCNPKITMNKEAGSRLMPDNKGEGAMKEYDCQAIYRLLFNVSDTFKLFKVLLLPARRVLHDVDDEPQRDARKFVRINSITEVEGLHDTYCFNEPKTHRGIFNGMLTGNCSEITIYSDDSQVGVCNLASICLPKFVIKHNDSPPTFDYNKLNKVTQTIVYNMNRVMDNNKYPIEQAKYSDDLHRPIGVGVQGLADVFMMMGEPFDSDKSRQVNSNIFETIYFAALTASNRLAVLDGSYSSFKTSMAAQGILQHNLWDNQSVSKELNWNWDELRYQIQYSGLRNSLLTCLMPTAGTSIIMENSESVEVPTSFLYTRSTLSGRFQVVNKYLMKDLKKLGLWNKSIRDQLIQHDGSVQSVIGIPQHIKNVYRTVFEYKMSSLIQCCADRERFICQSASNNRYVSEPSIGKLTKAHLLSWKLGIKTSSYYTRVAQVAKGKKFVSTVVDTQDEICTSCMA
jgi:ribonucleoside-diphosphate reductase alpha chain